jgi:hypothetical protein
VALLLDSGQSYGGRAYQDCLASVHRHHVPIVIARRGMRWSSGDGVTLAFGHPARTTINTWERGFSEPICAVPLPSASTNPA